MDIGVTIAIAVFTSGAVTGVVEWILRSQATNNQRRWEIKREACLDALEIVDIRFADYDWTRNNKQVRVDRQGFVETARVRSCFNRLILVCKDSKVPELFEKCLNLRLGSSPTEELTQGSVAELRAAIRKELGFGRRLSTKVAWIEYITWRHQGAYPQSERDSSTS